MLVFLARTSQLLRAQISQEKGAHSRYTRLLRGGLLAWRLFHAGRCWLARAEDSILTAKQVKRRRLLLRCFRQFVAVRDEEKEKRGAFEGLTPPPIIVQPRISEGTRRPPLTVSFQGERALLADESTPPTGDDVADISIDSLDDGQIFGTDHIHHPDQTWANLPTKKQSVLKDASKISNIKSKPTEKIDQDLDNNHNNIEDKNKNYEHSLGHNKANAGTTGHEDTEGQRRRGEESSSEVSSLATSDSYLPLLQGLGAASREQLPLSYHLYNTANDEASDATKQVITRNTDDVSVEFTSSDNETVDIHVQNSKKSLPLSHQIFLQQQQQKKKKQESRKGKGKDEANRVLLLSSDSDSSSCSDSGDGRRRVRRSGDSRPTHRHKPRLTTEVDRRFRQHSLKRFVSFFYKWKRQSQTKLLLRRVFAHAMMLWENRYQRRHSALPFHLLRHILNIWKFAVSLAQQRRQEDSNLHRALMYRGISLVSKVFVKWAMWTRQTRKKHAQLETLERMTKQVCFLGLVMLFQKLLVRYDKARTHYRMQSKKQVFAKWFDYAIVCQERHAVLRTQVAVTQLRARWRSWRREYKSAVLKVRTSVHVHRRHAELKAAYWLAWSDKFHLFRRHGLFARQMERVYIRKKAQVM
jgi:hypothetical protein